MKLVLSVWALPDINEALVITPANVSWTENQPVGTILVRNITWFDQDHGDYPTFTVSGASALPDDQSDYSNMFGMDPATGRINLTRAQLDFETKYQYTINFDVVDHVRLVVPAVIKLLLASSVVFQSDASLVCADVSSRVCLPSRCRRTQSSTCWTLTRRPFFLKT